MEDELDTMLFRKFRIGIVHALKALESGRVEKARIILAGLDEDAVQVALAKQDSVMVTIIKK